MADSNAASTAAADPAVNNDVDEVQNARIAELRTLVSEEAFTQKIRSYGGTKVA